VANRLRWIGLALLAAAPLAVPSLSSWGAIVLVGVVIATAVVRERRKVTNALCAPGLRAAT